MAVNDKGANSLIVWFPTGFKVGARLSSPTVTVIDSESDKFDG